MGVDVKFINATAFNKTLTRFANRNVPEKFDALMIKIVSDLATSTIFLTPVRTGYLRGGWNVSLGTLGTDEPPGPDPGGNATLNNIKGKLSSFSKKDKMGLIGKTIWFYNNVLYAEWIEFGTDKMAPFAMLRTSLEKVRASIS
jgi:hypothetical protein